MSYILVAANGLVNITRGELIKFLVVAEDDDGNIDGTKDGEFVRLLEQTALALQKGAGDKSDEGAQDKQVAHGDRAGQWCQCYLHGAVPVILDGFDLNLSSAHDGVQMRNRSTVKAHRQEMSLAELWLAGRGQPRTKESGERGGSEEHVEGVRQLPAGASG